jgi:FMN phosphatase YigB (HAD superfamily)/tRNA(Leu) C34 or U34 (ribose-2'-O)-methylase TrmL
VPVRAVTFDADDTLWDFSAVAGLATAAVVDELRNRYPDFPGTPGGLTDARRAVGEESPDGTSFPLIRRWAIQRFIADHIGDDPGLAEEMTELFFDHRRRHVTLFEDVIPMLDALDDDLVLGVITNGNMAWESTTIADRIDFWLAADQTGVRKPDPRVFHMAAAAAGCPIRQVVHVGDEPGSDVVGAVRAGARAVLLDRHDRGGMRGADAVIESLADLPDLLAKWNTAEIEGVGVGPHPRPWPDDDRLDPELLAGGDRRNVADRFRYWRRQAILAELDRRRHPFHVAIENWRHDLNIGTVVRTANAFGATAVHIIGHRRWNKRGAMVTDRYQHVHHHPTIEEFVTWAEGEGLEVVGVDNLPGSEPIETALIPEKCAFLFGQEGTGLSEPARTAVGRVLSIAQYGSTRSINAGVAAGIAMHTWIRQHTR